MFYTNRVRLIAGRLLLPVFLSSRVWQRWSALLYILYLIYLLLFHQYFIFFKFSFILVNYLNIFVFKSYVKRFSKSVIDSLSTFDVFIRSMYCMNCYRKNFKKYGKNTQVIRNHWYSDLNLSIIKSYNSKIWQYYWHFSF